MSSSVKSPDIAAIAQLVAHGPADLPDPHVVANMRLRKLYNEQNAGRRERRLMRRAHRRLIRENRWYECGCTPRCDWYASAEWKCKMYMNQSHGFCLEPTPPTLPNVAYNVPISQSAIPQSQNATIPLSFWFCSDPGLSIPHVAIPRGQRNVDIRLAELTDIADTGG
jgi:hypothetical protein